MAARGIFRGRDIYFGDGDWRYCDTGDLIVSDHWTLPCGECGMSTTPEGHDGCLGTLPEDIVMNACCGHGRYGHAYAYVQYWDGSCIRGLKAVIEQHKLKKLRDQS